MSTIVTRAGKGSPLTHNEVDANFENLNADKVETSALSELIDDRVAALAVAGTNMTITYNDGAGTLTFDASGGGGTPGGNSGEVQYNNAGAFAGAADVEIEGGQLRLPAISTPTAPASGGLKLFGKDYAVSPMPFVLSPSDVIPWPVQPMLGEGNYRLYLPGGGTTDTQIGWPTPSGQGTATAANLDAGIRGHLQRKEWLVTSASTTAVAAMRFNTAGFEVNSGSAGLGGFFGFLHGGPSTGVAANSSHRFFMGLADSSAASDVDPSSLLLIVGIGYDSADTNVQFMHNDGTGTATKIDLGASFPKPNVDRGFTYRLRMFAPPGTTRTLSYEVTYLETGAVATGTVTTNLPNTNSFLTPKLYTSVGGVSAVTGVCVGPIAFQTEPVA